MQRRVAVFVVFGENFELRILHQEFAAVGVELHLPENGQPHPFGQNLGEVAAVEPAPQQRHSPRIAQRRLK